LEELALTENDRNLVPGPAAHSARALDRGAGADEPDEQTHAPGEQRPAHHYRACEGDYRYG
jgi:hypothetical protein